MTLGSINATAACHMASRWPLQLEHLEEAELQRSMSSKDSRTWGSPGAATSLISIPFVYFIILSLLAMQIATIALILIRLVFDERCYKPGLKLSAMPRPSLRAARCTKHLFTDGDVLDARCFEPETQANGKR